jgi:superfamily II DNA or RNA helicase
VIAGQLARNALDQQKRVLWVTGREEILRQTFVTFNEMCGAGKVGILMRDERPWWFYPEVTVASWDTLKARWNKSDVWHIPADLFLVDEAHLSLSEKMCETIMPHYREKTVIGLTATPARKSGRGLGTYFTRIIQVRSVRDLMNDGYLAHCEYWAGSHADLSKVKVDPKTRDYKEKELARAAMEGKLIGDVVDNWFRIAKGRHTIVFAVDIAHAQALTERYQAAGVAAEVIHSKMTHPTRTAISDQFKARQIEVLVNVGVCLYGYDAPTCNCVVLARPTKSIVMHHQQIGRGIRPKPDGDHCKIIDHADNVRRLGCIEDEIRWRLDEGKEAATNVTRDGDPTRGKSAEAPPTTCAQCNHIFSRSRICPKCGWEKPAKAVDVQTVDADLVKIRSSQSDLQLEATDRELWFRMALGWCDAHRKKRGFACHRFREKFKVDVVPKNWSALEPNGRIDAYMRAGLIRFAKRKRNAA